MPSATSIVRVPSAAGAAIVVLNSFLLLRSGRRESDVEADVQDVAVMDDVGLALEALLALPGGFGV